MAKLITTSVVRGSQQGQSHGGVYIIDIENQDVRQVINWNTADIDWQGRGWDRGLRGIAIDGEIVYIVASDELFAYTKDFEPVGSWRNQYLKHAHEICTYDRVLYVTSTAYDSILGFDFTGSIYDPGGDEGPLRLNKLHLNNVYANEHGMYISGMKSGGMLHFNGDAVNMAVTLPPGTHNARPWRDGVLFNDTNADALRYAGRSGEEDRAFKVPRYDPADIENKGIDNSQVARQGFARGLCLVNDRVVAGGSSPSTVSLYDLQESKTLLSVNLSMDIRNAIHGLEVWPF
jgi:hypothetical protein